VAAGVRCRGRGAPSLRLLEQVEKPILVFLEDAKLIELAFQLLNELA
jgi:hypothetical protein